jgi:hypothetical protein
VREPCEDFRIARRVGCARSLNWTFSWRGDAVSVERALVALEREGFVSIPTVAGLAHYESPFGQVLLVPRNMRIELRVPYTVELSGRSRAAVRIARRVACALRAAAQRGEES